VAIRRGEGGGGGVDDDSHGVEISIAGGVGEMVRGLTIVTSFFFIFIFLFFFIFLFSFFNLAY
jgi:hypothetical protein